MNQMRRSTITSLFASTMALALTALLGAGCSDDSSGTPKQDAAPCVPTTCTAQNKNCGSMPDGCGGVLTCGDCTTPETCGGGGAANVCGTGATCTPTTCSTKGKNCGGISDDCADVINCGTCQAPQSCGAGGTPNVCGDLPQKDAGSTQKDGSSAKEGECEDSCMQQSGAVCCKACGACNDAAVKCMPQCSSKKWDCEQLKCF
jgi:hypothetical protein